MLLRSDIIALRVQVEPGLANVRCQPRQIQHVLLNLVTNARDALRGSGGARKNPAVTIGAERGQAADTVCLVVEDNGPGISAQFIERMFDPFCTTKSGSGGTGLGLYLAKQIIAEHGSRIVVRSSPGIATRFCVELPAARRADSDPTTRRPPHAST
ncbi:MAG: ATP-binding protein [Nannocystaceae bacterium]